MKNYIRLLLTLTLAWTAFGQAPVQRNPWSTNVTGNAVRGNNNLSVTNLTSGTNWLFYGVQAATVARLTDITNHGTGLFVLRTGDTMTGSLATVGLTNTGGMTNTGIIVGGAGIEVGTYVQAGGPYSFMWAGRSQMASGANGYVTLWNAAATDFYGLRFGGTASTNAMLYYTSAGRDTVDGTPNLEVKLGDGSDWTDLKFKRLIAEDAASVTGNARGPFAHDLGSRNAATKIASGTNSFVVGTNNTASGFASIAMGSGCTASAPGAVAIGESSTATSTRSVAVGYNSSASGIGAVALGYSGCTSSGTASFAAGTATEASGTGSIALGRMSKAPLAGQFAFSGTRFVATGDAQMSILHATALMTLATSTVTNLLAGDVYTLNLPANTSWAFTAQVVGRTTDAGTGDEESAGYEFKGLIERDNTAAATRIVGTETKVVIAEDDAAWDANVSADTTNGALTITVTGNNETTVRWNATVYLTQLGG